MPKDRQEKKRMKKLAEKKRQARQAVSLAYTGNKYRKDELVPALMHAEIGIYQTYILTERKIFDQTVVSALERLIKQMRAAALSPLVETPEIHYDIGREEDLLIENIRRSWALHFATEWRPPKDDLIGVLRTILGSIETWRAPGPRSQSYLRYIAGFLTKQVGVSVELVAAERTLVPATAEDELILLGRQWIEGGSPEAQGAFLGMADRLLKNGEAIRVHDVCHLLTGAVADPSSEIAIELNGLIQQARGSLPTEVP
ncbi:MAG: hypothetical protein K8T91_06070 [Planctomycetes bacterium]|nr:hypothetical protein [Planctomycetota bacterium]